MDTDFQSSAEITSGPWYHDCRLGTDAVSIACRCCQAQVIGLFKNGICTGCCFLQEPK